MTAFDCWMTTASLFWGMCIWTFLGGIVTTLLIHLNAASSEYTAKITALNQYMAHRRLPQVTHPLNPSLPRRQRHHPLQCKSLSHRHAGENRTIGALWLLERNMNVDVPYFLPGLPQIASFLDRFPNHLLAWWGIGSNCTGTAEDKGIIWSMQSHVCHLVSVCRAARYHQLSWLELPVESSYFWTS